MAALGNHTTSLGCCIVRYGSNVGHQARTRQPVAARLSRRDLATAPLMMTIGSKDPVTIMNSVLSAYGLPTVKASSGYLLYDEFEDNFFFEYPRSWVVRPNTQRSGIYVSNFQTADRLTVEEFARPVAEEDLLAEVVEHCITPASGQQNDRLEMPSMRLVKSETLSLDGQEYLRLQFPSQTITRSGYNIRRKHLVSAAVRGNRVYVLDASSRSDQFTPETQEMLEYIRSSFRLR